MVLQLWCYNPGDGKAAVENMHDAHSAKATNPNAYLPSPSAPILFHTSVLDEVVEMKK